MPGWFESRADAEARLAFGQWLVAARHRLGCSQATLGGWVGVHQSTISRLESGRIRYLHFRTGIRLLLLILEAFVVPRPDRVAPVVAIRGRW